MKDPTRKNPYTETIMARVTKEQKRKALKEGKISKVIRNLIDKL